MKLNIFVTIIITSLSLSSPLLAQIDDIQTSPSTGPNLTQLGGTTAYVLMKHDACDGVIDCATHVLANKSGNLNIKFKISMTCPAGRKVTYLAYQVESQSLQRVVNSNTSQQSYSQTITIQPFSLEDLEKTGQAALGGAWPTPGAHNNTSKSIKKTMKKSVEVSGTCSGLATQKKVFPVTVTATFEDKDFPSPPVP